MKLLFDNNISHRLVEKLTPGIDCNHVARMGLDESADEEIWQFAQQNDFHIVTKDDDFVWLSNIKGYPPKVVWLRVGNCKTSYIEQLLRNNADAISDLLQSDVGLIDVMSFEKP